MKTKTTRWKWLGALAAAAFLSVKANAAANLNIDVTIGGTKSVTVNTSSGTIASTSTAITYATANQTVVSGATTTVQNTSGILSEQWLLSTNGTSIDNGGGGQVWNLATSTYPTLPGADAFAVQAVFGSSMTTVCPAAGLGDWDKTFAAPLTSGTQQYTNTLFADTGLATGGVNTPLPDDLSGVMYASAAGGAGFRSLCYRVILPLSTTKTHAQIIQIIVTAN